MTDADDRAERRPSGAIAHEWWLNNCAPPASRPDDRRPFDPAIRARLRRCRTNTDAATIPAAVALATRLHSLRRELRPSDPSVEAALGLARVLAHVTENAPASAMRVGGWKQFPGENVKSAPPENQPRLSDTRFRRLLGVKPGEEQVTAFIRLVTLLGGALNVADLSRDFLQWGRNETRRRWAFEYYAAAIAAPNTTEAQTQENPS